MASEAFVLNASVALKWYLPNEEQAEIAALLLNRFAGGQTDLFAPLYIRYEVAAVLGYASLRRPPALTPAVGRRSAGAFFRLAIPLWDTSDLIEEAFPLVGLHRIALYDALYLALAIRLSVPVITADAHFYRQVRRTNLAVWLGDWTAVG